MKEKVIQLDMNEMKKEGEVEMEERTNETKEIYEDIEIVREETKKEKIIRNIKGILNNKYVKYIGFGVGTASLTYLGYKIGSDKSKKIINDVILEATDYMDNVQLERYLDNSIYAVKHSYERIEEVL